MCAQLHAEEVEMKDGGIVPLEEIKGSLQSKEQENGNYYCCGSKNFEFGKIKN